MDNLDTESAFKRTRRDWSSHWLRLLIVEAGVFSVLAAFVAFSWKGNKGAQDLLSQGGILLLCLVVGALLAFVFRLFCITPLKQRNEARIAHKLASDGLIRGVKKSRAITLLTEANMHGRELKNVTLRSPSQVDPWIAKVDTWVDSVRVLLTRCGLQHELAAFEQGIGDTPLKSSTAFGTTVHPREAPARMCMVEYLRNLSEIITRLGPPYLHPPE